MFLFTACGQVKQVDTSDIKDIMRNSKVKRVTEKDLLGMVSKIGEEASIKLNGDYKIECVNQLDFDGNTIELYNTQLLSDNDQSVKGQLLDAYKFGFQNKENVGSNIQKINDTLYVYSFPIEEKTFLRTSCGNDLAFVLISKTQLVKKR